VKIKIKEISQCVQEMTLTIEAQKATQDYKKVLNKFKNYVAIPGFRKGKAPVSMIERMYGDMAKEEFYNQKLGEYYKAAIDEKKINPITQGEAKEVNWKNGEDLQITFSYEIMPKLEVKKYKELEVPYEKIKFTKKMIETTLEDFRHKMATETDSPNGAKNGDKINATINFLDDEDNITKSINREFILGDNPYSKTFNKNLTGAKVGDEIKTKLFNKSQKTEDKE
jgi:trigger factor